MKSASRIVIGAELWHGATGAGLAHGFRKLGWDVVEVDHRNHFLSAHTRSMRLAARLLAPQCTESYNQAVLEAAERMNASAFLTVKGQRLRANTLATLQRHGITTINYFPDFHFDHPGLDLATFANYDHFFTTKSFQVDFLRAHLGDDRTHLLHHGYSTLVHRPLIDEVTEEEYITDVLYVGNHSPFKENWLRAVAKGLPEARLKIVGSRWTGPASKFAPKADVSAQAISGDSFARLIQTARINIAVHFGPTGPNHWEDLVSGRTFQIPACRGFMLHIDSEEVRGLFEAGKEIDVFSNADQLCDKIRYYLANPGVRREMEERAFARCVPAYSYDSRSRSIAEAIWTKRQPVADEVALASI